MVKYHSEDNVYACAEARQQAKHVQKVVKERFVQGSSAFVPYFVSTIQYTVYGP